MTAQAFPIDKKGIFKHGSQSFFLSSTIFAPTVFEDVCTLYNWCRLSDDQADAQEHAPSSAWAKTATEFDALRRRVELDANVIAAFQEGLEWDKQNRTYDSVEELEMYCYRVAGTVGLLMCQILKITDPKAPRHAIATGVAMQMTNICRDVREDALRGRVYLPLDWLKSLRLSIQPSDLQVDPSQVFSVVRLLLFQADRYYEWGRKGLRFLPWRAAWAVASASRIYQAIGNKIIRLGPKALNQRTVVGPWAKLRFLLWGLWDTFKSRKELL